MSSTSAVLFNKATNKRFHLKLLPQHSLLLSTKTLSIMVHNCMVWLHHALSLWLGKGKVGPSKEIGSKSSAGLYSGIEIGRVGVRSNVLETKSNGSA